MIVGWPHIRLGTLSRFDALIEAFDMRDEVAAGIAAGDLWSTRHEKALDPRIFGPVVPAVGGVPTPRPHSQPHS